MEVDKSKINNCFEGYKLSTSNLPIDCKRLASLVDPIPTRFYTTSYLYSKIAQEFNQLFFDPWYQAIFYIDIEGFIYQIDSDRRGEKEETTCSITQKIQLPKFEKTRFSSSISFPSNDLVVASNGEGKIYLIRTGVRSSENSNSNWTFCDVDPVYDLLNESYLLFSKLYGTKLYVLSLSLTKTSERKQKDDKTDTCLNLNVFQLDVNPNNNISCTFRKIHSLTGNTFPYLCWLSQDNCNLFVVSEKSFSIQNDGVDTAKEIEEEKLVSNVKYFKWHQSRELVVLSFDEHAISERNINIDIKYDSIELIIATDNNKEIKLAGKFEKEVIAEASKWFINDGRLEIALLKKEIGEFWSTVLLGEEDYGIHVIEGEEEERISQIHQSLAHLTSDQEKLVENDHHLFNMQQLEECDETEEDIFLYMISLETGKCEKLSNFGNRQMLFRKSVSVMQLPSICFRNDFDGILWELGDNNVWNHSATFDAFGYVIASKTEQKFVNCTPSFSYSFIADHSGNVYIYEGFLDDKQLKNMRTKKQYIASCRPVESVIGCQATDDAIFLLTNDSVFTIFLP